MSHCLDLYPRANVGGIQCDQRLRLRLLHGPHHRDRDLDHPHSKCRPRFRLRCSHGRLLPLPQGTKIKTFLQQLK